MNGNEVVRRHLVDWSGVHRRQTEQPTHSDGAGRCFKVTAIHRYTHTRNTSMHTAQGQRVFNDGCNCYVVKTSIYQYDKPVKASRTNLALVGGPDWLITVRQ